MVNPPLRPFAAILAGQAPWWRIGTSGIVAIIAYVGLVLAVLGLGSASVTRDRSAGPAKLTVTLLDRVPTPVPSTGPAPSASLAPVAVIPQQGGRAAPMAARPKPERSPAAAAPLPSLAASPIASQPSAAGAAALAAAPSTASTEPPATAAAPLAPAAQSGGSTTRPGAATARAPGATKPHPETVLPFTDGMARPKLLHMVEPEYTREARAANVNGLFLAKCVITTEGTLQQCRVVKGLPLMDRAVLSALARWRYTPVMYQGKPVAVDYLIQVRLTGP